eukprot:TRINITY_DN3150_c0_g2_i1.p1 TRINITY_DN3150_c0_g2~~TRINITY_DN3150_c0_g2_i1.p1  ORF type:complete len:120 (+),score=18.13 TRINITY_DN3150_c0_g2_i1:39-398(+)
MNSKMPAARRSSIHPVAAVGDRVCTTKGNGVVTAVKQGKLKVSFKDHDHIFHPSEVSRHGCSTGVPTTMVPPTPGYRPRHKTLRDTHAKLIEEIYERMAEIDRWNPATEPLYSKSSYLL